MASLDDLIQAFGLQNKIRPMIAETDPYLQAQAPFEQAGQLAINSGQIDPATGKAVYSTKDRLLSAALAGLGSGVFQGLSQDYTNRAEGAYNTVMDASANGNAPTDIPAVLNPALFSSARTTGSIFKQMQDNNRVQSQQDLKDKLQQQIDLQTNPQILAAEREKHRQSIADELTPEITAAKAAQAGAIEAARNGGANETDPTVRSALEKLADPEQGDAALTPIERSALIAKHGTKALSLISTLRNSGSKVDAQELRQFGGFKTLQIDDPNSPYKPIDPVAFKKGIESKAISLDSKTGAGLKEIGGSVVNALNQLEVTKKALKEYGMAQTQFGKNSDQAKALGQAVEQIHSGQLQLIQGMGAVAPLFTKGGMTDTARAQIGDLGIIPTKIYELDGLFDSLKASLQKPDYAIGKIEDAQREMLQRFGDVLKQSGLKYDKNIAGSSVIAHDDQGPFAPGQPLASEQMITIRNAKTGESKRVTESEARKLGAIK